MIAITTRGKGEITIRLAEFLGGERFNAFRAACQANGAKWSPSDKTNRAPITALPQLLEAFAAAELEVAVAPELVETLKRKAEEAAELVDAGRARVEAVDAALAARGLALYRFQRSGVEWLAPRERALLSDEMGCVDGDAEIPCSRAKRGRRIKLRDLYYKFHGGESRGRSWDTSIPTYVRSLCGDEMRLHRIRDVLAKGRRPVVKLTLESGKELRVTADHEIGSPDSESGFLPAGNLARGSRVLTNGTPVCVECGSSERVATSAHAKFRGCCRRCIYREKRATPRYKGRALDKDGYVRVARNHDHPRANGAGQALEHHLVMERHLGRYLRGDEVVHHMSGDKADNQIENLELMTRAKHATHHARSGGYRNLHGGRSGRGGQVIFEPLIDRVVSVVPDGEAEVYDIVCDDPHRNFVANGIVVHNCGKTPQALIALPEDASAIAVVPAAVRFNWARECEKWRADLTPHVVTKRAEWRWPSAGELVIVTYGMLPDEPAQAPAGLTVIADEIHACKSSKAQRSKRFAALRDAALASGGRVWGLTGTPVLNRPVELWNILRACGLTELTFGSWRTFTTAFNGRKNRWGGWDWGRPTEDAPERLRRGMLRRHRNDVLPDLPAKTRRDVEVEIDAKTRARCDEVLKKLRARGIDLERADAKVEAAALHGASFEEMSAARAALATAKLPAALELVSEYEEAAEPLVVFSAHRAPVDTLGEREGWATITGSTDAEERGRIVEAFQAGRLKGVAGTIGAMGVGVTLTRASQMLMVDLDWTPALNEQAEDRLARIGQTRGVVITRLVARHALDRRVAEILGGKEGLIDAAVNAAAEESDGAPGNRIDHELATAAAAAALPPKEPDAEPEPKPPGERLKAPPAGQEPERVGKFRGPRDAVEEHAASALLQLAALDPDRALVQNGVGFNATDGEFGHSLAQALRAYGRLSDKQWAFAVKMVREYHAQVGQAPEVAKR